MYISEFYSDNISRTSHPMFISAKDQVAVGAGVRHILPVIYAERNKAARPTTDKAKDASHNIL